VQRRIGDYLIKINALTPLQVATVLERQDSGDKRAFTEIATALGYLNQDALERYFSATRPCRFSPYCHFYGIKNKTGNQKHLQDMFCLHWPHRCTIFQRQQAGKPVSRSLWPGVGVEND
jgi:hypothetical protein